MLLVFFSFVGENIQTHFNCMRPVPDFACVNPPHISTMLLVLPPPSHLRCQYASCSICVDMCVCVCVLNFMIYDIMTVAAKRARNVDRTSAECCLLLQYLHTCVYRAHTNMSTHTHINTRKATGQHRIPPLH